MAEVPQTPEIDDLSGSLAAKPSMSESNDSTPQAGNVSDKNENDGQLATTGQPLKRQRSESIGSKKLRKPKTNTPSISFNNDERLKFQGGLNTLQTFASYQKLMEVLKQHGPNSLCLGMNDSPSDFLQQYLQGADEETVTMFKEFLKVAHDNQSIYNPKSGFPYRVIAEIINSLCEDGKLRSKFCHICKNAFKDFDQVMWKLCESHLMHQDCHITEARDGKNSLLGYCDCLA